MLHNIVVRERKLYLKNPRFVKGGINSDEIIIFPDEEWEACTTILVTFKNENVESTVTYLLPGPKQPMLVPKSILSEVGDLYISLTGYVKDEMRLTTQKMSHVYCGKVVESGVIAEDGEASQPDQMDYLSSLIQEVKDILDQLEGGGGTLDYATLKNKPSVNDVIIEGKLLLSDLGIDTISSNDIDAITNN